METFWYQLLRSTWKMAIKTERVESKHVDTADMTHDLQCLQSQNGPLTTCMIKYMS